MPVISKEASSFNSNLDSKDLAILEVLFEHADWSVRKIAKRVGLPITTVHNRIVKLRREDIIERYTIVPNYSFIGKGFLAYILVSVDLPTLKSKQKSQYDLVKELRALHFIERADIVSGGFDLVAVVRVSGVKEFDDVLLGHLQRVEGILRTQSLIVIH